MVMELERGVEKQRQAQQPASGTSFSFAAAREIRPVKSIRAGRSLFQILGYATRDAAMQAVASFAAIFNQRFARTFPETDHLTWNVQLKRQPKPTREGGGNKIWWVPKIQLQIISPRSAGVEPRIVSESPIRFFLVSNSDGSPAFILFDNSRCHSGPLKFDRRIALKVDGKLYRLHRDPKRASNPAKAGAERYRLTDCGN